MGASLIYIFQPGSPGAKVRNPHFYKAPPVIAMYPIYGLAAQTLQIMQLRDLLIFIAGIYKLKLLILLLQLYEWIFN